MMRKLVVAMLLGLLMSVIVAGHSAPAQTCRRVVLTIMNDPYFAHPICWDLPIGIYDVQLPAPPELP